MTDGLDDDVIKNAAQSPRSVVADGVEVVSHPLPDLIEADKHLASKNSNRKKFPIKVAKIVPPGAVE